MRKRTWLKRVFLFILFLAVLTGTILMFGPRPQADLVTRFQAPQTISDPDLWLKEKEAKVPGLRAGLEKEIIWRNGGTKAKTPLAIVYIHGFSASKYETRPLADQIAAHLDANLFYTRLTGHGATSEAMGEASTGAWMDDVAEALWIGSQIGERTVVIATSTGATLTTPFLTDPRWADRIAGVVYLSPNFGLKAPGSGLLTAPFAKQITRLIVGANRSFPPINEAQAKYWTTTYPSAALLPMAALVKAVSAMDMSSIHTPAFFYYSNEDQVVDAEATAQVFAAWGGPKARAEPASKVEDPYRHVLAGDALSPSGTAPAVNAISNWLDNSLPK